MQMTKRTNAKPTLAPIAAITACAFDWPELGRARRRDYLRKMSQEALERAPLTIGTPTQPSEVEHPSPR